VSMTRNSMAGSVNYRRKTVCAWCAWRPQGIATTILRFRRAIHPAMRSSNRKGGHDNSQTLKWDCSPVALVLCCVYTSCWHPLFSNVVLIFCRLTFSFSVSCAHPFEQGSNTQNCITGFAPSRCAHLSVTLLRSVPLKLMILVLIR